MVRDSKRVKNLKKHARRRSYKEGIFNTGRLSFGDNFLQPFAISINSSNSQVALMSSLLALFGPLSQTLGSKFIGNFPRKKIILISRTFEAFTLAGFAVIAFLFYKQILVNLLPFLLLTLFAIHIFLLNVGFPAWFSWTGDLVDKKYRGRFFSRRNLLMGFAMLVFTIAASIILDYFTKQGYMMFGFAILFFLALTSRGISLGIVKRTYEPKFKTSKKEEYSFFKFLATLKTDNFGKFSIFRGVLSFSVFIYLSLFSVYIIRILEFSYIKYIVIFLAPTFFSLMVLGLWGKFADRYGNYRILAITTIIIPLIPILWILNESFYYLIFVPGLLVGVAWSGFNLAAGNFIYDNMPPEKRGSAVSYYNLMYGIGGFLGATTSAILIKYLNTTFVSPIVFVYLLSSVIAMIAVAVWIPQIKEIRKMEKFRGIKDLRELVFKESKPTLIEDAHALFSMGKHMKE